MIDFNHGVQLVADIPSLALDWRNMPAVRQWCREVDEISEWKHSQWLERIKERDTIKMFGIHAKSKFIGVAGLTSISWPHGTAEWSLYIAPKHQGFGYAAGALKTLLDFAFKDLRLRTVWGEIFDTNKACLMLANKLGFIVEGKLRARYYKNGQSIDTVMVSILGAEWDSSKH